jgi:hypothetical protein
VKKCGTDFLIIYFVMIQIKLNILHKIRFEEPTKKLP